MCIRDRARSLLNQPDPIVALTTDQTYEGDGQQYVIRIEEPPQARLKESILHNVRKTNRRFSKLLRRQYVLRGYCNKLVTATHAVATSLTSTEDEIEALGRAIEGTTASVEVLLGDKASGYD